MSPGSEARPSERVRTAQASRAAALAVPGVVDLDAGTGGTFATVGGGVRVPGVVSAAASAGGFDVGLRLVCDLVPLPALAERVREAVRREVGAGGLSVEAVSIDVVDVVDAPSPGSAA